MKEVHVLHNSSIEIMEMKMKDRKKVAPPAPAHGLYLDKIIY